LLGEAHFRSDPESKEGERYIFKAIELAREQQARSFELRACLSLLDLYESRRNAGKCLLQLEQIYRRFDEGLDTADLLRAKARLRAL